MQKFFFGILICLFSFSAMASSQPTIVTTGDYCDFLNAVAATDSHDLFPYCTETIIRSGEIDNYQYEVLPGQENGPMTFITWLDAARYCNWKEHGSPARDQVDETTTETGSYTLNGTMTVSAMQNLGAHYFLPTEGDQVASILEVYPKLYFLGANADDKSANLSIPLFEHQSTGTPSVGICDPSVSIDLIACCIMTAEDGDQFNAASFLENSTPDNTCWTFSIPKTGVEVASVIAALGSIYAWRKCFFPDPALRDERNRDSRSFSSDGRLRANSPESQDWSENSLIGGSAEALAEANRQIPALKDQIEVLESKLKSQESTQAMLRAAEERIRKLEDEAKRSKQLIDKKTGEIEEAGSLLTHNESIEKQNRELKAQLGEMKDKNQSLRESNTTYSKASIEKDVQHAEAMRLKDKEHARELAQQKGDHAVALADQAAKHTEALKAQDDHHVSMLASQAERHAEKLAAQAADHESVLTALVKDHELTKDELSKHSVTSQVDTMLKETEKHNDSIATLKAEHESALAAVKAEAEAALAAVKATADERIAQLETEITALIKPSVAKSQVSNNNQRGNGGRGKGPLPKGSSASNLKK